MAFSACKRDSSWFDAAAEGNLVYLRANLNKYKRSYDARSTGAKTMKGWPAIFYTCYFNRLEAFQLLFDHEFDLLCDHPAPVRCPSLGRDLILEAGSSIVHLLVITNNVQLLNAVFAKWQENAESRDLVGCKNDAGQTPYMLAVLANSEAGYAWATHEKVVRNEIRLLSSREQNIVHLTALLGRENYAYYVKDLYTDQKCLNIEGTIEKLRQTIRDFFQQKDADGLTWVQLSAKEVDFQQFRTSAELKEKTHLVLQQICDQFE